MNEFPKNLNWIYALLMLIALTGCKESDLSEANAIPRYHLTMDKYLLEELYSRPLSDDERLPATLTVHTAGMEDEPVSVRFRGSATLAEPKKGFSISFDHATPELSWGDGQIAARASWRDPSFMRETLAMWIHNQLDTLAPRTKYFNLFINGSYEGIYQQVERIDERFLEARGLDPKGTLVRDEARHHQGAVCVNSWSSFSFNFSSLDRETALECIQTVFRSRNADWDEVLDLLLWSERAIELPADQFREEFAQRFDVDYFVRYMSARILSGEIDDLWQTDYWLYFHPINNRWILIPWDRNSSFGLFNVYGWYMTEYNAGIGQTYNLLLFRAAGFDGYYNEIMDKSLSYLESSSYNKLFDIKISRLFSMLEPWAARKGVADNEFNWNPNNHSSIHISFREHVESLTEYRDLRKNFLKVHFRNVVEGTAGLVRNISEVDIDRLSGSMDIWFVDDSGFTLGRFVSDIPFQDYQTILLSSVPGNTRNPLLRDWEIMSNYPLKGRLYLYYRNDVHENWYTGDSSVGARTGAVSIGRQSDIQMVSLSSGLDVGKSIVRPFLNRIAADITLSANERAWITTEYRGD